MEYVFGTKGTKETLLTKGDEHTDLKGFVEIIRENDRQSITDRFCIVEKRHSMDDEAGQCYDIYEINQHYRSIDNVPSIEPEVRANGKSLLEMENALFELFEMVLDTAAV